MAAIVDGTFDFGMVYITITYYLYFISETYTICHSKSIKLGCPMSNLGYFSNPI